ncbi:hypothetical protein ALC53_01909 [Atta colombica]|uniref:Uncharacterized protein n=1 Tax=Atta colombica TaxID=520822 RepID=A0A195BRD8_9HYME|nr:hypothetical protein ALC53_01909 [Atta colombica]
MIANGIPIRAMEVPCAMKGKKKKKVEKERKKEKKKGEVESRRWEGSAGKDERQQKETSTTVWRRLCEQKRILKYGALERWTLRQVPRQILSKKQDMPETEGAARLRQSSLTSLRNELLAELFLTLKLEFLE